MIATWLGSALVVFFCGFVLLTIGRIIGWVVDEAGWGTLLAIIVIGVGFGLLTGLVHHYLVHG